MRSSILVITVLVLATARGAAAADSAVGAAVRAAVDAGFTELERQGIARWYADHPQPDDAAAPGADRHRQDGKEKASGKHKQMPPGLARRADLPPGLSRHLQKNGRLPPGLEQRELPPALEEQLGAPPAGTERVLVGGDVILVDVTTGVIRDILYDVAR